MTRAAAAIAGLLMVALLALTAWYVFFRPDPARPFAGCGGAQVAGGIGSIGGPFELVDGSGRTVTDRDVFREPTLLYFGYTFCPDICPADSARNAEAVDLLAERGLKVQPVFISVDPERDTPDVVGDWVSYMHPDMVGLTGSPEQVMAAAQSFRVYYRRQEGDEEFYLVDHSTFSYLILPDFGVVDYFRRTDTADEVAGRTACFVEAARDDP